MSPIKDLCRPRSSYPPLDDQRLDGLIAAFGASECGLKLHIRFEIVPKYPRLVAASRAKPHSTANCEPRWDETKLAKLVHEITHTGSGGADHLRQCFLTNVRTDRLRAACLPEIREQQQHARKPPFTRIE